MKARAQIAVVVASLLPFGCDGVRLGATASAAPPGPGHAAVAHPAQAWEGPEPGAAEVGDETETIYGWDVVTTGDFVRWRHCESETSCGGDRHERHRSEVVSVSKVGVARPHDGRGNSLGEGEVDVLELEVIREK